MSLDPMTGLMFESEAPSDFELYGYIRVGGVEYKLRAWRRDHDGRRAWILRMSPHRTPARPGEQPGAAA